MDTESERLTTEQTVALQAIYGYFHAHGTWPSFIVIDRPLRRDDNLNTQAVLRSLPDRFIVKPHAGMSYRTGDELRLHLPGIYASQGGAEDIERFVRILRWFAEKEMNFEPSSAETMPKVTSEEVREHLGLSADDRIALQRLYAMLQLGTWGLAGNGSNADEWHVYLDPEIWRFRDVQTIEECLAVRAQWIEEAQASASWARTTARPALLADTPITKTDGIQNQIDGSAQGQILQAGVIQGGVHYHHNPTSLPKYGLSQETSMDEIDEPRPPWRGPEVD